jgi:radical SAM superfamily enzyme YgiQ (UPF0313 family)
MKVVLISTYELGRQPFGLASPAAWLRARGYEVLSADLSLSPLPRQTVREAGLVAFYLPMHTATRLAGRVIGQVRDLNPDAHLAGYGLYAPLCEEHLRSLGVSTIIGGEFEAALADLADSLAAGRQNGTAATLVPLERLQFLTPDRSGLPGLERYAKLVTGEGERTVGYTEASRGCKHLCRHCPVVPVYQGAFRVVRQDVVLDDIRRQAAAGAQHITFGDPDFFNGPTHALRIVEALHREFPGLTYDVTVKVEHLLRHSNALPILKETGCLFVTSAVESVDDAVLQKLEKGHTRRDFHEVVERCRSAGLLLNPTFIAFLPWTTRAGYLELLSVLRELDLIEQVSPVQLALRLLIPAGSRVLELEDVRRLVSEFDPGALAWKWSHADPTVDQLARAALAAVHRGQKSGRPRREIFAEVWKLAAGEPLPVEPDLLPRAAVPYLNEPWYC